ncbi:GNAT family protein [Paenibacillus sp. PK4536]|uniref:GNAT family N-acetyltransferase n=1 Tax=Paenibacillus sp. PK4536 TaxID=3024576 RepID=UPI0023590D71|nr:GNAT family protein [Paenibacillus sp. PK4536]WIM39249.1 GNAT family protein [Paenibacillus sp. PK4536]
MHTDQELQIRPITEADIPILWDLIYKDESPEWKKWDAPYYDHVHVPYEQYWQDRLRIIESPSFWVIEVNQHIIGIVSYYWEHEPSLWLEVGIVIYDPAYWSGGYGTRALILWIDHLFTAMPLVRVGFTTWSGNERMIAVGYKLGMMLEARLRKCRLYNGVYYDSIRMGILREEWNHHQMQSEV